VPLRMLWFGAGCCSEYCRVLFLSRTEPKEFRRDHERRRGPETIRPVNSKRFRASIAWPCATDSRVRVRRVTEIGTRFQRLIAA
jgi:hypothetical protein